MSEKIKLSKEELEQLKSFQIRNNDITFRLGQVDIQKAIIEGQRSDLLDKLANKGITKCPFTLKNWSSFFWEMPFWNIFSKASISDLILFVSLLEKMGIP